MADLPIEPVSGYYNSLRLKLHYLDWGNEEAPPLILLHGGRDHARSWDWVARALQGDYHVIAPDLRGHGDSGWSPDGQYSLIAHVYDFAELIHQLELAPVKIVAHSFGGAITMRYAALYPGNVERLVAIEGLGLPPQVMAEYEAGGIDERMRKWIEELRRLSSREPRRYATLEAARQRMAEENGHLSPAQVRHLTVHGVRRNEDGTYGWKFDPLVRNVYPIELGPEQRAEMWRKVSCPLLLVNGADSWFANPAKDGRADHFQNARFSEYADAGHWVHHDQLEGFVAEVRGFLGQS